MRDEETQGINLFMELLGKALMKEYPFLGLGILRK
jgi:hypothetical protein